MTSEIERYRILIRGMVQGVGFRPFVYRLAQTLNLTGFVGNTTAGVEIEAQGSVPALAQFLAALRNEAPPLAVVAEVSREPLPPREETAFVVRCSGQPGTTATLIAPDIGICPACLAELFDPANRRYRYPFINCTNCGPRYTIVAGIPYDRGNTSMRHFRMCEACQREYDDPADRRFHAQPNGCPACGPALCLAASGVRTLAAGNAAVTETLRFLQEGKIVAVKGLGGFHLAAAAGNPEAVTRLRQRKGRAAKPFAVMVRDLKTAHRLCHLTPVAQEALLSPRKPIVLALKREGHGLAGGVAPGQEMFGIMLPYTPLHHLLFTGEIDTLVMTSGNYSEEPLCAGNAEAMERLRGIADIFLLHDREIYHRCDDSVVTEMSGRLRFFRRSRGYAPAPLSLKEAGPSVMGVGGELKNTLCLLKGEEAFLSQHIGDLKNLEEYDFFRAAQAHLQKIFSITPELIAHDLHPGYLSSRWALEQQGTATYGVQHHHAHLAACLAENRLEGPAIGIILDGTGYGPDRTIWGGEVLLGGYDSYERFASFEAMPLPGGDAAIRAPWRTALAYLYTVFGKEFPDLPFLAGYAKNEKDIIIEMIEGKVNSPLTSSCGRLFDAIAAMSGGVPVITYEAEAALDLMRAAGGRAGEPFAVEVTTENGLVQMSVAAIVRAVVRALREGAGFSEVSQRFHATLIRLLTEVACRARRETGLELAALSGGVFQNRILFEGLHAALCRQGFQVAAHGLLPPNDGCLSLGQAVIGRRFLGTFLQ